MLFTSDAAEYAVPVAAADLDTLRCLGADTLRAAGIRAGDTSLVALNNNVEPGVSLLAEALIKADSHVAFASPQGRLRLLKAIKYLKPEVLIITPCGAIDLLARLYMEFNVDPLELELRHIILIGEIASPGVVKRIRSEFAVEVSEVYCDPLFLAPLAMRRAEDWRITEKGTLALSDIQSDRIASDDLNWREVAKPQEIVVKPFWCQQFDDDGWLRTGQVVADNSGDAGAFNHTIGEHVLIRGRWISLSLLKRELSLIDGIGEWSLSVDRGNRTLDFAQLSVGFERESLVGNAMWLARLRESIKACVPIDIDVVTNLVGEEQSAAAMLVDCRGHHLSTDRSGYGRQ